MVSASVYRFVAARWCGSQLVPSTQHGVQDHQKLTHGGGQRQLGRFVAGPETLVEGADHRVVAEQPTNLRRPARIEVVLRSTTWMPRTLSRQPSLTTTRGVSSAAGALEHDAFSQENAAPNSAVGRCVIRRIHGSLLHSESAVLQLKSPASRAPEIRGKIQTVEID
jgi:hypothetical protein